MPKYTHEQRQTKTCTKCGESKPLSEYHANKLGAHGVASRCKDCRRILRSEWHARNRESQIEKMREYREQNRAALIAKSRLKYRAHKEKNVEAARVRYAQNSEKLRVAAREQKTKNPKRHRAYVSVRVAVRDGVFPPAWTMVCEHCQEAQAAHWHHHKGYAEEFKRDVIALCTDCHGKAHWS